MKRTARRAPARRRKAPPPRKAPSRKPAASLWHALLFLLLLAAVTFPQARRAWDIAPIYADASIRDRVEVALRQTSAREGWLLSDMLLQRVEGAIVIFEHRPHLRQPPSPRRYQVNLATFETRPCAEQP